jgi:hypothetical protein
VTGAEWLSLLNIYNTWRDTKINEESPRISKVQGTTVAFSGGGYGGQTWTNIACWFQSSPTATQSGAYVSVSFSLIDAAQAIQSFIKEEADNVGDTATGSIDFGTITLGSATISLTSYPETFLNTPTLELSAGGKHYVTGPLTAIEGKSIEGELPATSVAALRSWYTTAVASTPTVGSYYPTSAPQLTGFNKIVAGSPVLYYTVTLTLAKVL